MPTDLRGLWVASAVAACLLAGAAAGGSRDADVEVTAEDQGLLLAWSDAEAALRGRIEPLAPRVGEPLRVAVRVGTADAKPHAGAVMLTLRPEHEAGGTTQTIEAQDGLWSADFVPRESGPHVLDVAFELGRPRVLHARLEVDESRVSRGVVWAVGGLIAALSLIFGVRRLIRGTTARPA